MEARCLTEMEMMLKDLIAPWGLTPGAIRLSSFTSLGDWGSRFNCHGDDCILPMTRELLAQHDWLRWQFPISPQSLTSPAPLSWISSMDSIAFWR